jgi:hypothetical protein
LISLVLPYWDRKEATDRALSRMAELYPRLDMEVVIVDDGGEDQYYAPPGMPWPILVKRLPRKSEPKNPCLPINVGVHAASGRFVAISNPEMVHRAPLLEAMRDEIKAGGPHTYVAAACWQPDVQRWHAHSTRTPLYADRTPVVMPDGAQYHFLAMVTRTLWDDAGGFDPEYREGAGYDDNDFLMRLARAEAKFVIRDDLIVDHPRHGARAAWTPEMFNRNRALFMRKWA